MFEGGEWISGKCLREENGPQVNVSYLYHFL